MSAVRDQRGVVLLLSLIILAVVTAIGIGVTTIIVGEIRLSGTSRLGLLAFYTAESGVERALYTVRTFREDSSACLDSGAGCTVPTIQAQTGSGFPDSGGYVLAGTAGKSASITANLPQDIPVQVDIFNVDSTLSDVGVKSIKVQCCAGPPGAEWVQVSWTGWATDGTWSEKPKSVFIADTDLKTGTNVNLPLDDLTAAGKTAAGYRVRLKSIYADATNVTVKAYADINGGGAEKELPARVLAKSVATVGQVKQALLADLPWKIPLGGLFDYVLFSEQTLSKDIATGTPIFTSGVIQIEDAISFPPSNSCTGCTDTPDACGVGGSTCFDCGWKATACSATTSCRTDGPTGSCRIGNCTEATFAVPIPDGVPAGAEYYLSLKAKYQSLGGEHITVTVVNPGNPDITLSLNDQWNAELGEPPDRICTIDQKFELKPVSGRKLIFSQTGTPYPTTNIEFDWYQLTTFKLFGSCRTESPLSTGSGICQVCGNGTREGTEECDGSDFGTPPATCTTRGFNNGGTLVCRPPGPGGCTIDDAGCFNCPDANCEAGENCPADASSCPSPPLCKQKTCTSGCGTADLPFGDPDACTPGQKCCGAPLSCTPIACTVNADCGAPSLCKKCTGGGTCSALCVDKTAAGGDCSLTSDGCCPSGCTNVNDADCPQTAPLNLYLRTSQFDNSSAGDTSNNLTTLTATPSTTQRSIRPNKAWTQKYAHSNNSDALRGVWASSTTNDVWVVGDGVGPPTFGTILHSPDSGANWEQLSIGSQNLNDVWGSGPLDLWAVGNGGVIYRNTSGTLSGWGLCNTGVPSVNLYGVFGAGGSVWAVGDSGTIVVNSGGCSWSTQISGTANRLRDVWAASTSEVWTVGESNTVRKCTSGCTSAGTTWTSVTGPAAVSWYSVYGAGASNLYLAGGSFSIGYMYYTSDRVPNPPTWTLICNLVTVCGSGPLERVHAVDTSNVWAVGVGATSSPGTEGSTKVYYFNGTSITGQIMAEAGYARVPKGLWAVNRNKVWASTSAQTAAPVGPAHILFGDAPVGSGTESICIGNQGSNSIRPNSAGACPAGSGNFDNTWYSNLSSTGYAINAVLTRLTLYWNTRASGSPSISYTVSFGYCTGVNCASSTPLLTTSTTMAAAIPNTQTVSLGTPVASTCGSDCRLWVRVQVTGAPTGWFSAGLNGTVRLPDPLPGVTNYVSNLNHP